jgi:hypothetical protein
MVSGDDNRPGRVERSSNAQQHAPNDNVYVNGEGERALTYTLRGPDERRARSSPPGCCVKVSDDLGTLTHVVEGEAFILGTLLDRVLEELRTNAANDNSGG